MGFLVLIYVLWRLMMWAVVIGTLISVIVILAAAGALMYAGAILYGYVAPGRTVHGQLRAVTTNIVAAAEEIGKIRAKALDKRA
jgi:hypothetical protein